MTSMSDAVAEKRHLRERVRETRTARGIDGAARLAPSIAANAIALVEKLGARTIATYMSTPDEPDTRMLLAWAHEHGVRVLLPIVRTDGLLDWAEHDGAETVGAFGLPEPAGEPQPPTALADVDLILVPAAAVDRSGTRLGWGRGFFDKALSSLAECPPVFAVAYDDEVVDEVPSEAHDQSVTGAVTERDRYEFTRS